MSAEFNDDDLPLHTRVAERLHQLGWRADCDAQHSNLRNALPELRAMLAPIVDDGGPAFPVDTGRQEDGTYGHQTGGSTWQSGGMTLRDYMAAHVGADVDMAAQYAESLVGSPMPKQSTPLRPTYWREVAAWWAEAEAVQRYLKADAMLKARAAS